MEKIDLLSQIFEFQKVQINMVLRTLDDRYVLEGTYNYNLIWNNTGRIGKRNITINVPFQYPEIAPELYLKEIPQGISHIYDDNSVCLATIGEIISFLSLGPTLNEFVSKFVDAFLYTLDWFEAYGVYPFGDREHGWKGLKSFYLKDWGLTEKQYWWTISAIMNNKFRGHNPCICGSGLKLRDCHGKKVIPVLKNNKLKNKFINEAFYIWEGERNEKK